MDSRAISHLQHLFFEKIENDWTQNVQEQWTGERWYKTFSKNRVLVGFPGMAQLPNGFFQFLELDIYNKLSNELHLDANGLSQCTPSSSFLKRFLGKNANAHSPHKQKLFGIAKYVTIDNPEATFQDWEGFLEFAALDEKSQSNGSVKAGNRKPTSERQLPTNDRSPVTNKGKTAIPEPSSYPWKKLTVFCLALLAVCSYAYKEVAVSDADAIDRNEVRLDLLDIESYEDRFTARVKYNIGHYNPSDFRFQLSRGGSIKRETLPAASGNASFMFHRPFGWVNLFYKDRRIANLKFAGGIDKWMGWTERPGHEPSAMVYEDSLIVDGSLKLAAQYIPKAHKDYYFTRFFKKADLLINTNDFSYEVKFRLLDKSALAECSNFSIHVNNSNHNEHLINTNFELKGCEHYVGSRILDSHISADMYEVRGKPRALPEKINRAFTYEEPFYENWNTCKIVGKEGIARYYMNGEMIYSIPYSPKGYYQTLSLGFHTKGTWEIAHVVITSDGREILEEVFHP